MATIVTTQQAVNVAAQRHKVKVTFKIISVVDLGQVETQGHGQVHGRSRSGRDTRSRSGQWKI